MLASLDPYIRRIVTAGQLELTRPHRTGSRPANPESWRITHFDERALGDLESRAWAHYYRHHWLRLSLIGLRCARDVFGLSWPEAITSALLVMRATRHWSPLMHNETPAAEAGMTNLYQRLVERGLLHCDPTLAAQADLHWWEVHRERQYGEDQDLAALSNAISDHWSVVFGVSAQSLRPAADRRAQAMDLSDFWLSDGAWGDSPILGQIRNALVMSYGALAEALA